MKKLFLLAVMAMFVATAVQAQDPETVTLKLKSGVSVTGKIIEESGDSMKIQTAEGDIFIYRINEISRIDGRDSFVAEKEPKKSLSRSTGNGYGDFKGYRSIIEFSGSAGTGSGWGCSRLSLSYVGGYNLGSYFYGGLGLGVAITDLCCEQSIDLPVYIHLRSAFLKGRRVSPYISMNIGYNIALSGGDSDWGYYSDYYYYEEGSVGYSGFYMEPTIGVEFRLKKKSALMVGLTFPIITGGAYIGIGAKAGFSF